MATAILSELTPQQQHATVILARLAAQREVKRRRQKQGIKGPLPFSTLSRLANEWLDDHPELYAEALASDLVQILSLAHSRIRVGRKGKSLFTTQVQKWSDEMIVGYARVSTDGQTLDAKQSALRQAGATQVFSEKISGVVTDRKTLGKALAALGPGDVLLVTRLVEPGVSFSKIGSPRCPCRRGGAGVSLSAHSVLHSGGRSAEPNRRLGALVLTSFVRVRF
jgi:hypothetical protein